MHEIRIEVRALAEQYLAADIEWWRENFPNVWPRKMRQLELFK